jgi:glycosyltransferase involved in cell wall biosynthesis
MMRSYERRQYERFPVGSVVSKAEAERARTLAPHLDVRVIPNGVDTTDYRPASDAPHDGGLLYLGSLRSGRNEDTAWRLSTEIFPRIRAVDPAARLDVVGWSPSARLLDYASSTPGVFVHGDADDIRPFLHRATVLLNPQPTGTGIKNSVLHALAMEVPCLVSPPVAEGIEGEDGRDYIVCGSDAEFADAALSLLADPKRARRIGEAGRRLVCDKYSWDSYAEGVVRMLTDGRGRSDG